MSGQNLGTNKRGRPCVSPPVAACDNDKQEPSSETSTTEEATTTSPPANVVWQQWTRTFRSTRRFENDLILEDSVDATVERHMSLPTKKRSLLDDDSDSDDEGNYSDNVEQRRHPLEFTPSGFLTRFGPQQITPVSSDPNAPPLCTLRRYGMHDDEQEEDEGYWLDRIPPPPSSFHRHSSKKRAVGVARPEPEVDFYPPMTSVPEPCPAPPKLVRGVSILAMEQEGLKLKGCNVVPHLPLSPKSHA